MREIKFRAWVKGSKEMLYEGWNKDFFVKKATIFGYGESAEVMQYTGLKDKNGKEIYEGDIIQYKSYCAHKRWWSTTDEIPIIEKEVQAQREDVSICNEGVKLKDGCFLLTYNMPLSVVVMGERIDFRPGNNGDTESKQWDFEIIGNIHENPDLIQ